MHHFSIKDKQLVVKLYLEGKSQLDIAKVTEFARGSISRIIYDAGVKQNRKTGPKRIWNEDACITMKRMMKGGYTWNDIIERYNIGKTTLFRIMQHYKNKDVGDPIVKERRAKMEHRSKTYDEKYQNFIWHGGKGALRKKVSAIPSKEQYDAAVTAFIETRGVTKCPTVFVVPCLQGAREPVLKGNGHKAAHSSNTRADHAE